MGFEDALVLSRLMTADLIHSAQDIKYAFRAYDAVRRPRAQELVRRSRRQGGLFCLQVTSVENLIEDMDSNQAWLWDVSIDEMLHSAKESFLAFKSRGEKTVCLIEDLNLLHL